VLSPAVHTLAEILKNAGYATGAFTGRGHVHRSRGFGQGFDVYVHDAEYRRRRRYEHSRQLERALQWMDEHRDRKFFLFFHTYAVHDPYVPPADVAELFDDGGYSGPVRDVVSALRSGAGEWEDAHRLFWDAVDIDDPHAVRFVERLYDGAIRHMDGAVMTPLLDRVDALGLRDRTLVVFTSDHGEAFGEHGRFLHGDLYEETLRVPLILRFPGRLDGGQRVSARVQVIDIMPTILDLVGVPTRTVMQGRSLVPVMRGDTERAMAASEFSAPADGRVFESLRSDNLSYIVDRSVEYLFDLDADPGEHRNLLAERRAEAEAMRSALTSWRQDCRRLGAELGPRGVGAAPSADTLRQLRALGYVN
jgi:arylsulfatase A-like enzyme